MILKISEKQKKRLKDGKTEIAITVDTILR